MMPDTDLEHACGHRQICSQLVCSFHPHAETQQEPVNMRKFKTQRDPEDHKHTSGKLVKQADANETPLYLT